MTDKEININGYDISKCPKYSLSLDGNSPCGNKCKETPDCAYKLKQDLAKKNAECEMLKFAIGLLRSSLGARQAGKNTLIKNLLLGNIKNH